MAQNTQSQDARREAEKTEDKLNKVSTGGHLGGTHFGQAPGDAKTKHPVEGGNKARPNDGSN